MLRSFFRTLTPLLFATTVCAQPQGGVETSFSGSSDSGTAPTLRGILFKPQSPAKGAVVLVHGSGGWSDDREGHYGRALSAAGYAVLAIDSFGPRGIKSTAEDQSLLSSAQMTLDAFAAKRHLASIGYDANRMALMGFSKGGQVALFAADKTFFPEENSRFAVTIPFYPGCSIRPQEPQPAAAMFMALGEKDDLTGVKPCQELADSYARAGGKVVVKVYPDATHAFDGNFGNGRSIRLSWIESYSACTLFVGKDGKIEHAGKKFGIGDPELTIEQKKTCMKKGATLQSNPTQRARATDDVIAFLNSELSK